MILIGNVFYNFGKGGQKMKKITAYKVNNLSKVDTRFYVEGDHFLTDRSVGILTNGKIKTIQGNEQLENDVDTLKTDVSTLKTDVSTLQTEVEPLQTDVSTLKTDLINLTTRVEQLEGDTGE